MLSCFTCHFWPSADIKIHIGFVFENVHVNWMNISVSSFPFRIFRDKTGMKVNSGCAFSMFSNSFLYRISWTNLFRRLVLFLCGNIFLKNMIEHPNLNGAIPVPVHINKDPVNDFGSKIFPRAFLWNKYFWSRQSVIPEKNECLCLFGFRKWPIQIVVQSGSGRQLCMLCLQMIFLLEDVASRTAQVWTKILWIRHMN